MEPLAKLMILSISIALGAPEGCFLSCSRGFARTSMSMGEEWI